MKAWTKDRVWVCEKGVLGEMAVVGVGWEGKRAGGEWILGGRGG